MFEDVLLEEHQLDLLIALVEADWSLPRDQRRDFFLRITFMSQAEVHHPGLPDNKRLTSPADLDDLAHEGLIRFTRPRQAFSLTPRGFEYYRYLRARDGDPVQRMEATVTQYFRSADFRTRYMQAFDPWSAAEARLGSVHSQHDLTTVGHLCREAMQAFATALVQRMRPPNASSNPANTVARLRTALDSARLGETERPFLEALVAYWGTVSDLVQRQEHGGQRERQPLVAEDARRVVFHTCLVMYEVDRAIGRQ
jgi:hypothetical protein